MNSGVYQASHGDPAFSIDISQTAQQAIPLGRARTITVNALRTIPGHHEAARPKLGQSRRRCLRLAVEHLADGRSGPFLVRTFFEQEKYFQLTHGVNVLGEENLEIFWKVTHHRGPRSAIKAFHVL